MSARAVVVAVPVERAPHVARPGRPAAVSAAARPGTSPNQTSWAVKKSVRVSWAGRWRRWSPPGLAAVPEVDVPVRVSTAPSAKGAVTVKSAPPCSKSWCSSRPAPGLGCRDRIAPAAAARRPRSSPRAAGDQHGRARRAGRTARSHAASVAPRKVRCRRSASTAASTSATRSPGRGRPRAPEQPVSRASASPRASRNGGVGTMPTRASGVPAAPGAMGPTRGGEPVAVRGAVSARRRRG